MRVRAPYSILLISLLSVCTLPALALPGEATAVIQNCGTPQADIQQPGGLNGLPQRHLTYPNGLTLNFEPEVGGWSFISAARGPRTITRDNLEQSMPCFSSAMNQAAAAQHDAPILYETYQPSYSQPFGIPYFWLIVLLVLSLLVVGFWPARRRRTPYVLPDTRRFRRPNLLTHYKDQNRFERTRRV